MSQHRSIDDWLSTIYHVNPFRVDLTLNRLKQLLKSYPVNVFSIPVVTVTGTNGKGSTVAFLQQILQRSGYRVGVFTSPHVRAFNERIQLNNRPVTDAELCQAFAEVEAARGEIELTFFEYSLLAALTLFQQTDLDILLLEVGVGGIADAVNCVDADISVITSIGLDHQHWLGNTREEIARNKTGIMRPGKPLVCGDPDPPKAVSVAVEKFSAPYYLRDRDFQVHIDGAQWRFESPRHTWSGLEHPHLPRNNAATALQVVSLLMATFSIPESAIRTGIRETRLLGRMQALPGGIAGVMDVAHNADSVSYLANQLRQQTCHGKTLAVFSALQHKDLTGMLAPILPAIDAWYIATLDSPRACELGAMLKAFSQLDVTAVQVNNSIASSLAAAREQLSADDRLVAFGSFLVVSELLQAEEPV